MFNALSILDGRNRHEAEELQEFFSESGLIFFRVLVEVSWFNFLATKEEIPLRRLNSDEQKFLTKLVNDFSHKDLERIKEIEKSTNHDVKAVELFLREKLGSTSLKDSLEWIHFAATSEDINNLAYALLLREGINTVLITTLKQISLDLKAKARAWQNEPLLARTHGQPASPTTVGKELLVFALRLERQLDQLKNQEYLAKFAGATGNYAAHQSAFQDVDWLSLAPEFISSFNLTHNPVVTQIEPHDFIAEISHNFVRINNILLDLARDLWQLVSFDFFGQKTKKGEVGSSVMPHKVNPIDFENAEGNLGVATSLFDHFANKLPISRLQRDLSDSTVLRSMGTAFGHSLIAYKKILKGLGKLELNSKVIAADLKKHPEVLAEAVQTVLRAEGIANAYDLLKEFTRGKAIDLNSLRKFIQEQPINPQKKEWLLGLTPQKFTGLASSLVDHYLNQDDLPQV
jgi:adenylosuccinate lyase